MWLSPRCLKTKHGFLQRGRMGVLQNRAGGAHARNSDLGSGGVCAPRQVPPGRELGAVALRLSSQPATWLILLQNNSLLARTTRAFLSCCNPLPPSVFNNQASLLESVEEISQVRVSPGGGGGGGSCAVLAPLLHSTTNSTSGFGRFNLSTWGVLRGKR